jgi:hypothetical protein
VEGLGLTRRQLEANEGRRRMELKAGGNQKRRRIYRTRQMTISIPISDIGHEKERA